MVVRAVRLGLIGVCLLVLSGMASCVPPTEFKGSSQFPGGALGCFNQCAKLGMEMATFVYVGEYSTACACKPKLAGAAQAASQADVEAAVAAAGAGVELQRREAEARRAAAAAQHKH
jgi:hypothetical protein